MGKLHSTARRMYAINPPVLGRLALLAAVMAIPETAAALEDLSRKALCQESSLFLKGATR